jgi:thioredoxin
MTAMNYKFINKKYSMKKLARFCMMAMLIFVSCNNVAQDKKNIPVDDFEKAVSGGNVQLLDVRRMEEYTSGHLPNALQADWTARKEFEERVKYLDKNKTVYLYCLSGGRSGQAADYLREQGFTNVINMEGGISAWKNAGKKLEGVPNIPQITMADYQEKVASSKIVLVDFGAPWCPPCKKMEPVIEKLSTTYQNKVKIEKIDAGIHTNVMKELNVAALPTFILYKNGKETWRKQGIVTAEEFAIAIGK